MSTFGTIEQARVLPIGHPLHRANAIHMALDEVPAEPVADLQRPLEIQPSADAVSREVGAV